MLIQELFKGIFNVTKFKYCKRLQAITGKNMTLTEGIPAITKDTNLKTQVTYQTRNSPTSNLKHQMRDFQGIAETK